MKNWNRTGKIKAIVLGLLALPNLLMPVPGNQSGDFVSILAPLIIGAFLLPLIIKFNGRLFKREISTPSWNDNPITVRRPLSFWQFAAFFSLTVGLSIVVGTAIKFQEINFIGLTAILYGVGLLIGVYLTLKWTKAKAV